MRSGTAMVTDRIQIVISANQDCLMVIRFRHGCTTHSSQSEDSTINEYELTRKQVTLEMVSLV